MAAGCTAPPIEQTDPPPVPTDDTAPEPPPGPATLLEADCVQQTDNALRFDCDLVLDRPDAVDIELVDVAPAERRTFTAQEQGTSARVTLWGMRPEADHTWTMRTRSKPEVALEGSFTTGRVPNKLSMVPLVRHDDPHQIRTMAVPLPCTEGTLAMIDDRGTIRWYEDFRTRVDVPNGPYRLTGFQPTEDASFIASLDQAVILEIGFDGSKRMELHRGTDFSYPVHHDLYRANGRTYALFAHDVMEGAALYVVDGVYVFDDTGALEAEWVIDDLWTLQDPGLAGAYFWGNWPSSIDFSHGNSVWVDARGDMIVSFRHLHAVAKVRMDPVAADFGTLQWTLVGDAASAAVPDLAPGSSAGIADLTFNGQHSAREGPDGDLWMFDNKLQPVQTSRVLRWRVDVASSTADLLEAWDVGASCHVQGGTYPLEAGSVLSTCATNRRIQEFAPGLPDPVWELEVGCVGGGGLLTRAAPIDLGIVPAG